MDQFQLMFSIIAVVRRSGSVLHGSSRLEIVPRWIRVDGATDSRPRTASHGLKIGTRSFEYVPPFRNASFPIDEFWIIFFSCFFYRKWTFWRFSIDVDEQQRRYGRFSQHASDHCRSFDWGNRRHCPRLLCHRRRTDSHSLVHPHENW